MSASLAVAVAGCDEEQPLVDHGDALCEAFLFCDDHDLCTDDIVSPDGCTCTHLPANVVDACRNDFHCDDDNPCTVDTCEASADCDFSRCQHAPIEGCRQCGSACDDGNDCTAEACDTEAGVCIVTGLEPGCTAECDLAKAWLVGDAVLSPPSADEVVSLVGRATASSHAVCDEVDACRCETSFDLADTTSAMVALVPGGGDSGDWSCDMAGDCSLGEAPTCRPLLDEVDYIVWGRYDRTSTPQRLQVAGYCLSPAYEAVFGAYAGTLVIAGSARTWRFHLELAEVGSLIGSIACEGECPTGTEGVVLSEQSTSAWSDLRTGIHLAFILQVDGQWSSVPVALHATASGFVGTVEHALDGAQIPLGTLTLERLPR